MHAQRSMGLQQIELPFLATGQSAIGVDAPRYSLPDFKRRRNGFIGSRVLRSEHLMSEDLNMSVFTGRLCDAGFDDISLWVLDALRAALETTIIASVDRHGVGCVDDEQNHLIQRAAEAVLRCIRSFWFSMVWYPNNALQSVQHYSDYAARYGGPCYDGPVVGVERWQFWVSRFEQLAEREELKKPTRELADLASAAMQLQQQQGMVMGRALRPEWSFIGRLVKPKWLRRWSSSIRPH